MAGANQRWIVTLIFVLIGLQVLTAFGVIVGVSAIIGKYSQKLVYVEERANRANEELLEIRILLEKMRTEARGTHAAVATNTEWREVESRNFWVAIKDLQGNHP